MKKISFTHRGPGFAFFMLFLLAARPAHAQTIYDFFDHLYNNTILLPLTIEILAYIMGLYALYSALMALKETTQEPGKKSIRPAIIRFAIAAALIALPRTVLVTSKSMTNTNIESMQALPTTKMMNGIR